MTEIKDAYVDVVAKWVWKHRHKIVIVAALLFMAWAVYKLGQLQSSRDIQYIPV